MPETAILPKRNLKPRSAAIAKLDTRLPRCVRRRLPCTQVPLKCHSRPSPYQCADRTVLRRPYRLAIGLSITGQTSGGGAPTPIANAKSRSDRCPVGFSGVGGTRCKKSLSMMDLSLPISDPDIGDLMSENGSIVGRLDEVTDRPKDLLGNTESAYCSGRSWTDATPSSGSEHDEIVCPAEDPTIKATNVVCRMLMLNAWRRRRAEIAQLGQQVENLHLQIEFLRRLLLVENDRVGRLNGELHREKSQLEEVIRERDAVKSEKEKLEGELKRVEEEASQERSLIVGNLRNELFTAQDQLKALNTQMAKDREKVLKLREDKRILLDKVSASEAMIRERGAQAEKAETTVEDLQMCLTAQVALAESTQKQLQHVSRELQVTEAERQNLEKRLKSSESNGTALCLRAVALEDQLADREAALQRMESEYNSQMTILNELREQLLRQSQEGGWSSRMLQIAGNIMRASIVRTFVFLSNIALMP